MRYYKIVNGSYIVSAGSGNGGTEVSLTEYESIMAAMKNRPIDSETVSYKLRSDLTWESFEVAPVEMDELSEGELISILLGGDA